MFYVAIGYVKSYFYVRFVLLVKLFSFDALVRLLLKQTLPFRIERSEGFVWLVSLCAFLVLCSV
uniref:Uncharacterized protein n=1 Tax=Anopheles quadriannulatus TaxID=34691 RepID=A0A182XTC0_ANOQN